ncbi:MAG: biotin synthase [Bacteroidia bacterium]|nr:MAG: biotin synthase [Bacteroidia bacterium]
MRQRATIVSRLRRLLGNGPNLQFLDPKEAYDLWAETYDAADGNVLLHTEERIIRPLLDSLHLADAEILDAGCGTGRYMLQLLEKCPRRLVGFDSSLRMLDIAQGKFASNSSLSLVNASFAKLPFPSGRFDLILSTLAVDHVPGLAGIMRELTRVLKSGGRIILSCFHPFGALAGWKRTFSVHFRTYAVRYIPYSVADYLNAFSSAGLTVVRVEEPVIDERVKHLYTAMGKEDFYERSKGHPLSLIFVLQKAIS